MNTLESLLKYQLVKYLVDTRKLTDYPKGNLYELCLEVNKEENKYRALGILILNAVKEYVETNYKTVWLESYRPFTMGGSPHVALKANVRIQEEVDLGKGFKGYVLLSPKGRTFIAEATSGGLVGSDLEQVRRDIEESNIEVMQKQVLSAQERLKSAVEVSETSFWESTERLK